MMLVAGSGRGQVIMGKRRNLDSKLRSLDFI